MGGVHGYQLAVTKAESPTTAAPADTYPATGPADDEAPDAETTTAATTATTAAPTTATTAAPTTATTAASTTARKGISVLPKWLQDLLNGRGPP
ncbi:MUCL1 isoform 2 [Pongo abelii]|uniref:MUCL1 isoform 2 n=1 Tax=Pongo abelii TaxID=9601 RepID=A0A2J8UIE5_PONAB|nr:MUCL1 isoform 2 [Pongo abelii]